MSDDATRKLELLKLARTIVNEEYINRRAEEHNRWVAVNDHSLRTTKIRTPYPPFTTYPSEDVIIAKALAMYNFIATPVVPAPIRELLPVIEESAAAADPEPSLSVEEPPVVDIEVDEPVTEAAEDPDIAELLDRLAQEENTRSRPMLISVPAAESADAVPELVQDPDADLEESHLLPGWVKGWIRK